MATITVPEGYGNVILVAAGLMPVCATVHAIVVGRSRRKAGIPYPNHYATAEQAAQNRDAYRFNCAQRAHGNFLENLPQTIVLTLVAGLRYPIATSVTATAWTAARLAYLYGYVTSDKPNGGGRHIGFLQGPLSLVLLGMSVFGVGWPLSKFSFSS